MTPQQSGTSRRPGYVYCICNKYNGRCYIGSTIYDASLRLGQHLSTLKHGHCKWVLFQRDYNNYGEIAFSLKWVKWVKWARNARKRECDLIREMNPEYNGPGCFIGDINWGVRRRWEQWRVKHCRERRYPDLYV